MKTKRILVIAALTVAISFFVDVIIGNSEIEKMGRPIMN